MGKKLKNAKKKFGKMSKKKKVLIGAGVAAVAVAGIAGSLYVGKTLYDRRKKGKGASGHGSREVVDDGPDSPALAPYRVAQPKTFMDTVPVPDAVALGLSYNEDSGAKLNLLAAAFDHSGQNLGYIQAGGSLTKLFNGAVAHTGESQADTLGDHENIIVDLRAVPPHVGCIMFGTYLVNPPTNGPAKAYIHMLPMLRDEQIQTQAAQGGTREINWDSDEEETPEPGTRGIGDEDDEESFVRLYMDDLDQIGAPFFAQRGLVGGKLFRDAQGLWRFTPYRTVVSADAQFGLWPALEHYAKPQQAAYQQPPPGYAAPAYGAPAPYQY